MFLIVKEKGGFRAIQIRTGDSWDFYTVQAGKREVRIVLRVRGHRHLLYSPRGLTAKYPALGREQLTALCDEIIAAISACIEKQQAYIEFAIIAGAAECRHQRLWRDLGLIAPDSPAGYHGHPIDPKTELLVSYVRINHGDIILVGHEPPVECEQEELPY